LNNKVLFNISFFSLIKYTLKYYYSFYQKINYNKILKTKKKSLNFYKKGKYNRSSIVNKYLRFCYFKRIYYNVHKFKKIYEKNFKNSFHNKYYSNHKYYGIVTINICLNNTYITLTNLKGDVISTLSGGLLKIKGPKRSTNVASETIANKMVDIIIKNKIKFIILRFNGVTHTRKMKSAFRALKYSRKYAIIKCLIITPKSHNGIRRKKRKRL